jgi:hypothetical protein
VTIIGHNNCIAESHFESVEKKHPYAYPLVLRFDADEVVRPAAQWSTVREFTGKKRKVETRKTESGAGNRLFFTGNSPKRHLLFTSLDHLQEELPVQNWRQASQSLLAGVCLALAVSNNTATAW